MKFQVEVSSSLAYHVKTMLERYIEECAQEKIGTLEWKSIYHHAFPLYFSAVAAVEAFMNEVYLSEESRQITPASPLWEIDKKKLDFRSLNKKLILVPQSLFGKTFNQEAQPFRDMDTLIKVRNHLIHHKRESEVPSFIQPLIDRQIIPGDTFWFGSVSTVIKLSSVTGALWAYNTICRTVIELLGFSTPEYQEAKFYEWFTPFPEDYVQRKFAEK